MNKIAAMVGAAVQLGSGYGMIQHQPIWWVLDAHLVGAVLWGIGAMIFMPQKTRESGLFAATIALLIPGVGWLVSLVTIALLSLKPPRSADRTLLVWRDRNLRKNSTASRRIGVGASIAEILRGPDPTKRRSAILASKELDVKQALPLLRKGLQDSDEQVRIYAQNILSGMLESFEGRIKELEKKTAEKPTDTATAVSLAEQYFELIYLDVAGDEETSNHLLNKAVNTLEQAAVQSPGNSHIAMLRMRYALRQRDTGRAAQALESLMKMRVDEQMILPWRVELAYQRRDWQETKKLLNRFIQKGYMNPRIEQIAKFWRADTLTP